MARAPQGVVNGPSPKGITTGFLLLLQYEPPPFFSLPHLLVLFPCGSSITGTKAASHLLLLGDLTERASDRQRGVADTARITSFKIVLRSTKNKVIG